MPYHARLINSMCTGQSELQNTPWCHCTGLETPSLTGNFIRFMSTGHENSCSLDRSDNSRVSCLQFVKASLTGLLWCYNFTSKHQEKEVHLLPTVSTGR